jgi:hypothetical protein
MGSGGRWRFGYSLEARASRVGRGRGVRATVGQGERGVAAFLDVCARGSRGGDGWDCGGGNDRRGPLVRERRGSTRTGRQRQQGGPAGEREKGEAGARLGCADWAERARGRGRGLLSFFFLLF